MRTQSPRSQVFSARCVEACRVPQRASRGPSRPIYCKEDYVSGDGIAMRWRTIGIVGAVRRILALVGVIPFLCLITTQLAVADMRVALVIGNSTYRSVTRLDNPTNDAKLMADTLRALGFTLVGGGAQLDLDKPAFDNAVQSFS